LQSFIQKEQEQGITISSLQSFIQKEQSKGSQAVYSNRSFKKEQKQGITSSSGMVIDWFTRQFTHSGSSQINQGNGGSDHLPA
jgi:hypothetical protein